jgi:DNA (cytosine-5)-methyltransferase 1
VIDLFSGVGGLSLGAFRAGFNVSLAVDNDRNAMAAHRANFPKVNHASEDILTLSGGDLLSLAGFKAGELVGLIGGPPCQGFSRIGLRDRRDPRNDLFRKFFDLVRETQPKFYLAENVPGIMDDVHAQIRADAVKDLDGYVCLPPFKVNAADYGAPTSRTRVLFVGYKPDACKTPLTAESFIPSSTAEMIVRDALEGLPTKIRATWISDEVGWRKVRKPANGPFWDRVFDSIPPGVGDEETLRRLREEQRVSGCIFTKHTPQTRKRFQKVEPGRVDSVSRARRLDPWGVCPTLRAGTGPDRGSYQAVRPIHPSEPRVITPREAARLQGFPDWFRFAPTKWHSFRQIGNSVSPILAEAVLSVVKNHLVIAAEVLAQQAA